MFSMYTTQIPYYNSCISIHRDHDRKEGHDGRHRSDKARPKGEGYAPDESIVPKMK